MSTFETPMDFDPEIVDGTNTIRLSGLMELSQGGPVVGKLHINGKAFSSHLFGGPLLVGENYLVVPVYVRGFLKSGFKFAKIALNTYALELHGKITDLIFLDHLENGKVYYYDNLQKSDRKVFEFK